MCRKVDECRKVSELAASGLRGTDSSFCKSSADSESRLNIFFVIGRSFCCTQQCAEIESRGM
jgi:hypothetical protein